MDTWSSYLFWAWIWVTWCAKKSRKLIIAYAVDSGRLSRFNQKLVRHVASNTDLIITRTQAAANRLKTWKVSAPIEVTDDPAFDFNPLTSDKDFLKRKWSEPENGVIGVAPIDYYLWPVTVRIWGSKKNCYRWPYYFSDSKKRQMDRETLAVKYASFADEMIEKYGKSIALICMEELDEPLAGLILSHMNEKEEVRIFSSREYNASQMTAVLRSLDLLITSRYHAGILSLGAMVPQIAIGHDQRLKDLYRDLEICDEYFLDYSSADLFQSLKERVEKLLSSPEVQKKVLSKNVEIQQKRDKQNPVLLKKVLNPEVVL